MTAEEFVEAANKIIFQRAPEWYAPATHPLHMRLSWHDTGRYARMGRLDDGTYAISVDRAALALPVIEDMAHVLMHEYIHVKVWEVVYGTDFTKVCKELRSEMIANRVMIEEYHSIGYRKALLNQAVHLYAKSRSQARTECPSETWFDQPIWPRPRKVKERKAIPRWEEFQRDSPFRRSQTPSRS